MVEDNLKEKTLEQIELETFEDSIKSYVDKLRESVSIEDEKGENEIEYNKMLFRLNEETGEVDLYFAGTQIRFATVHEETGIEYDVKHIEAYIKYIKTNYIQKNKELKVEDYLPEGFPDIDTLKNLTERQGDDSKAKEHEAEEQEREPREEEGEQESEVVEEEKEEQEENNDEKPRVLTKLPPNALKLNKHRMADPRTKVGDELERATGEKGVEFYIAPVGNSNNLEYKLFIEKNGVYEEVELPTPRGKNPTDNVMRMSENGIDDKTAVSILYIGEDRSITIFEGGPYAEVDIANRDYNGEYSSIPVEQRTAQGKVGYENRELREAGGNTVDARKSVSEKRAVYITIKELEQRGVPNEINPAKDQDGIAMYEISAGLDNLKAELKAEFTNRLIQEEGKREVDAKVIADKMVENMIGNDKGVEVDYETAKMNAEDEYADEQKQPGDLPPGSRW